jgi:hypothetical protein
MISLRPKPRTPLRTRNDCDDPRASRYQGISTKSTARATRASRTSDRRRYRPACAHMGRAVRRAIPQAAPLRGRSCPRAGEPAREHPGRDRAGRTVRARNARRRYGIRRSRAARDRGSAPRTARRQAATRRLARRRKPKLERVTRVPPHTAILVDRRYEMGADLGDVERLPRGLRRRRVGPIEGRGRAARTCRESLEQGDRVRQRVRLVEPVLGLVIAFG